MDISGTSLCATFVIGAAAAPGPRTVTVTTAGGTSGGIPFTINVPPPNEQIFNFIGGPASFTVPAGVTSILIDVTAPKGGNGDGNAAGGNGGRAQAKVSLAPGTLLVVLVGGPGGTGVFDPASSGAGGFNGGGSGGRGGGGGGGASSVFNQSALRW